ncbi:MAG: hypothetical protein M5U26_11810 [Planctomycetota bacterium]|nr:hypothetical protein [Planctomycetota bacterium]
MGRIPSEPTALRRRIREHERKLRRDKHGCYDDGAGKRFLLAPLYLLAGDVPGALESFRWYEREFPDDSMEPGHALCWTLALHRGGKQEAAVRKLGQAMLCNRYLIPHLLSRPVAPGQFWEGSNLEWSSYVLEIPGEYYALWTAQEKAWASHWFDHPFLARVRAEADNIDARLATESVIAERRKLIERRRRLEAMDEAVPSE